jgi:radical SAM enzyme (TIGR01210 family)
MKQYYGSPVTDADLRHHPHLRHVTLNKKERYSGGLRWKLGINTNPCIQFRRGRRCIYCGFLNFHNPVAPQKVAHVFGEIFEPDRLNNINRLELYVSGSFFDDEEVSPDSRLKIMKLVSESDIKEVLVESRPEFITEENLQSVADVIDPGRVTIAVGVETMDDKVRRRLHKGFSTKEFIESLNRISVHGMSIQAYLLLNPPTINDDKKAMLDVISSAMKLISVTRQMDCGLVLAIQPYFVARGSLVAELVSRKNHIRPPWLYTVALTLKLLNTMKTRTQSSWQIILGNENDNVVPTLVASNYTSDGRVCSCTEKTRQYLNQFNISSEKMDESVTRVLNSSCDCRKIWESQIGTRAENIRL